MLPRTYSTPGHETDESDHHDHDGDGGFVAGYVQILIVYGFCIPESPGLCLKRGIFFFFLPF